MSLHNILDLLLLKHTLLLYNSSTGADITGIETGSVDIVLRDVLAGPADAVSAALVECGRNIERYLRAGTGPQALCVAINDRGKPADIIDTLVSAISGALYADALVEVRGMGASDPT